LVLTTASTYGRELGLVVAVVVVVVVAVVVVCVVAAVVAFENEARRDMIAAAQPTQFITRANP
jgi:hypothetical protein